MGEKILNLTRTAENPRYRANAMRESAALEARLIATARSPHEQVLAQLAGSMMLAIRTWHWRRRAKRKVLAGEGADLAAHTNTLLRILERFESSGADKPPELQSSAADTGAQSPARPARWVRPDNCTCAPGSGVMCQACADSWKAVTP